MSQRPARATMRTAARLTVLACAALVAVGVSLPVPAYAAPKPTPAPKPSSPTSPPVKDDGVRTWSIRPAGPNGGPDNRTHFTLQGAPGTRIVDRILVTNSSKVAVPFSIYATDAFNTTDGLFNLLPAAQKPADLGTWVTFPHTVITVPAGASVPVPFTITIPSDAQPGDHAGGVVVSLAQIANGPNVNVDSRVAVRIYLRIPGNLRPRLSVSQIGATYHGVGNPFGDGRVTMTYQVSNPGNIRLRAHVKITVKNAFGSTLATLTPPDLPELLPAQNSTFHASFAHIFPAGPLTVTVALTPYADPGQPVGQTIPGNSASAYAWAVPWLLLLLILLLIAGGLAFWWSRRRTMLRRLDTAMTLARDETLRQPRTPETAGAGAGRSSGPSRGGPSGRGPNSGRGGRPGPGQRGRR